LHELRTPEAYFYTASAPENSAAVAVDRFEPVARGIGLLSPIPFPGSTPVYRFKTDRPRYLLVTSPHERDSLVAAGYALEGVAGVRGRPRCHGRRHGPGGGRRRASHHGRDHGPGG